MRSGFRSRQPPRFTAFTSNPETSGMSGLSTVVARASLRVAIRVKSVFFDTHQANWVSGRHVLASRRTQERTRHDGKWPPSSCWCFRTVDSPASISASHPLEPQTSRFLPFLHLTPTRTEALDQIIAETSSPSTGSEVRSCGVLPRLSNSWSL